MRLVFGRKTTDATNGGSVSSHRGAVRVDSLSGAPKAVRNNLESKIGF